MEKEFVTYEQALALNELGFDAYAFNWYSTNRHPLLIAGIFLTINPSEPLYSSEMHKIGIWKIKAPLKQQVFRWFREKYNMLANVYSNASGFLYEYHDTIGGTHRLSSGFNGDCELSGAFTTYEKAENALIDKLIEISKEQQ
jgi:hypothetical protein